MKSKTHVAWEGRQLLQIRAMSYLFFFSLIIVFFCVCCDVIELRHGVVTKWRLVFLSLLVRSNNGDNFTTPAGVRLMTS